jgi:pimeloyl-ACP methyl ester carboxylesterase
VSPSAPTVLILHGLGARGRNHLASAAGLPKSFQVLLPDQIGHGHSDKPRLTYRIRTFSDFAAGFLRALGVRRAHVTGSSLGGWIAADLAIRYPPLVDRLVLVDSAGVNLLGRRFSRDDIPKELYVTSLSAQRRLLERVFLVRSTISDARVEATFRDHVQDDDAGTIESMLDGIATDEEFFNTRARQIQCPPHRLVPARWAAARPGGRHTEGRNRRLAGGPARRLRARAGRREAGRVQRRGSEVPGARRSLKHLRPAGPPILARR